jgi:hypothetical protein
MLSNYLKAMGLQSSSNSLCLFTGRLVDGEPPFFVGIYVDDIIYLCVSTTVECKFEELLSTIGTVDFTGQVSLFLGIEFSWIHHDDGNLSVRLTQQSFAESLIESLVFEDLSSSTYITPCNGNLSVHLTQQSFAESLIESLGFEDLSSSTYITPYRSGLSIDSILHEPMTSSDRDALRLAHPSLVGSLNWLAHTIRPDLSTVIPILAQHQSNPSPGHMEAPCYATKYLAHTKTRGLYFTSQKRSQLESFLHFPIPPHQVMSMPDANWGPQDASKSRSTFELPLFASRSMSAYYIDLLSPLHWLSKRQSVTAGSLAEAKIYATDKCVKFLQELTQILDFLGVKSIFMLGINIIYHDNCAYVQWSKCTTTKVLKHIQMKENHVQENISSKFAIISHVDGKVNLADIFTKEIKDTTHFVAGFVPKTSTTFLNYC